ncbi:hypothetical protein FHG87_007935 [Trinorchestia longiramus]|nr:hypothetical protein FHG87_007935 [Trinorchestia longiramus]
MYSLNSQLPDGRYSYGFIRARVVAVFSSLVLMALLACCTLRVILMFLLINSRDVLTSCSSASNAFLLGLEVLVLTAVISGTMSASPIDCVVRASAANAATHPFFASLSAISKTHLVKTWRPRSVQACSVLQQQLCPVLLLVLGSWLMLVMHSATASFLYNLFEQASTSSLVLLLDTVTALCILVLAASYLWQPLLLTIRVLMQAVCVGSSSALQRCLHRAATVDGVLELRSTRVWALTPHCLRPHSGLSNTKSEALVCCVLVRLQRDADPATVVGQLRDCLQHCVVHLTVQVYKDEWVQASSPSGLRGLQHPRQLRSPSIELELMNAKVSTRTTTGRLGATSSNLSPSVVPVVPSAVSNAQLSQDRPALYDYAKIRNLSTTVCEPPVKVYYQTMSTSAQTTQSSTSHSSSSYALNLSPAKVLASSSCEPTTVVINTNPTPSLPSHITLGKKSVPSPHYVNVNLPPYEQDVRGLRRSRIPSGSVFQSRNDATHVLPTISKDYYLDGSCRNFTVDPYKSDFHPESYITHSNVSDDQKSNLNLSQTNSCREYRNDALPDSRHGLRITPDSVLLANSNPDSSMNSVTLQPKWPYSSQHDLNEHAYVNIEFTEKS